MFFDGGASWFKMGALSVNMAPVSFFPPALCFDLNHYPVGRSLRINFS
jgi:hypothetical protein